MKITWKNKSEQVLIISVVTLFYFASVILISISTIDVVCTNRMMDDNGHYTDRFLISNLIKNREKFETLIRMFQEDKSPTLIHSSWMMPEGAISNSRWAEYKKIFEELKIDVGMSSRGPGEIKIVVNARGFVIAGSSKGYFYKPKTPTPLFKSLDETPPELMSLEEGFLKIGENWYLYHEFDD